MEEEMDHIEKELVSLFKALYSNKPLIAAWFEKWKEKAITDQSATWLQWAFTIDENKSAVFFL